MQPALLFPKIDEPSGNHPFRLIKNDWIKKGWNKPFLFGQPAP
jgi:hypothetical protein